MMVVMMAVMATTMATAMATAILFQLHQNAHAITTTVSLAPTTSVVTLLSIIVARIRYVDLPYDHHYYYLSSYRYDDDDDDKDDDEDDDEDLTD